MRFLQCNLTQCASPVYLCNETCNYTFIIIIILRRESPLTEELQYITHLPSSLLHATMAFLLERKETTIFKADKNGGSRTVSLQSNYNFTLLHISISKVLVLFDLGFASFGFVFLHALSIAKK